MYLLGCIQKNKDESRDQVEGRRDNVAKVFVIKTEDREEGIEELFNSMADRVDSLGNKVAIKANFNSGDPFPASTHIDTLENILRKVKDHSTHITLAERSGMGITEEVFQMLGVTRLARGYDVELIPLDREKSGWIRFEGEHWRRGFLMHFSFLNADSIIQTCCLKTHAFGGHFTLSLKNSVGMVAKYDPEDNYNYMAELHSSRHQRLMIAEINSAYTPDFIILDAIRGFRKGGPATGEVISPNLMVVSEDRVAMDAVGVALLRVYGTTPELERGNIMDQEQLKRAIELGLGAKNVDEILIEPLNSGAEKVVEQIEEKLREVR